MTDRLNDKTIENELRQACRQLKADDYVAIKGAYFKATEGLRTLADTLEQIDGDSARPGETEFMTEHLIACQAIEAMNQSLLGKIV